MKKCHHKCPGSLYTLTWLILAHYANSQPVICNIKGPDASFGTVNGTICECDQVRDPPWEEGVEPAPAPLSASVKFTNTQPTHPKFAWTYKSQYLDSVEGFYIEVFMTIGTLSKLRCNLLTEIQPKQETVVFKFDGCCPGFSDGFQVGDNVSIKVHSIPMYNRQDESYFAVGEAVVPGPQTTVHEREHPNKRRRHRNYKNRTRQHNGHRNINKLDESTRVPQYDLDESVDNEGDMSISDLKIAVAVLATFIFAVFLFAGYRCFEKRRKKAQLRETSDEMEPRRILVIGDEYNGKYTDFINAVVEKLKKYGRGNTEVTTNVRKMTEIGKERIVQWVSRNLSESDIVVLIIVDPEQVQSEDIEGQCGVGVVSVTLSIVESETLKSNFKKSKKKFFTLNTVSHQKNIPYCTQFNFENDLKNFFRCSLGPHFQYALANEDSSNLQEMLKIAQSVPPKDPGAIPKRRDNDKTESLNNLGASILYRDNDVTIAPYVKKECNYEAQNGAISIECNSCKP